MSNIKAAGETHVGLKRSTNQDTFAVEGELGLFLVCDGMGGHAGGEIASALTRDVVIDHMRTNLTAAADVEELIHGAVAAACGAVVAHATVDTRLDEMGTTLVFLLVHGANFIIAHVGDSRCYSLRVTGMFERLTRDHNGLADIDDCAEQEVAEGRPRPNYEWLRGSVMAQALTRCIGGTKDTAKADLRYEGYQAGNRYLLCSDGLTKMVSDEEIKQILLANPDPGAACMALIAAANAAGGDDNITVVVVNLD